MEKQKVITNTFIYSFFICFISLITIIASIAVFAVLVSNHSSQKDYIYLLPIGLVAIIPVVLLITSYFLAYKHNTSSLLLNKTNSILYFVCNFAFLVRFVIYLKKHLLAEVLQNKEAVNYLVEIKSMNLTGLILFYLSTAILIAEIVIGVVSFEFDKKAILLLAFGAVILIMDIIIIVFYLKSIVYNCFSPDKLKPAKLNSLLWIPLASYHSYFLLKNISK